MEQPRREMGQRLGCGCESVAERPEYKRLGCHAGDFERALFRFGCELPSEDPRNQVASIPASRLVDHAANVILYGR